MYLLSLGANPILEQGIRNSDILNEHCCPLSIFDFLKVQKGNVVREQYEKKEGVGKGAIGGREAS